MPGSNNPQKERISLPFFRAIIFSIIGLIGILIVVRRFSDPSITDVDLILLLLAILFVGLLYLSKKGYLRLSVFILVFLAWWCTTYILWTGKGIYDAVTVAYLALIFISSLLLDWKFATLFLIGTFLSIWLNTFFIAKGILVPEPRATEGQQAIELLEENNTITLILMDIKLPVFDGYKTTREIKKIRPDLPVIAQTSFAMTSDREKQCRPDAMPTLPNPSETMP